MTNAIRYAPEGGPIDVHLDAVSSPPAAVVAPMPGAVAPPGEVPRWALMRVRDTGLGIPVEGVPRAFDRFWRAAGPARQVPGTGLGLYTCRAIAAAHGGHIWVEQSVQYDENEEQGWHGTVIALLLPLAGTPASTGAIAGGEQGERRG